MTRSEDLTARIVLGEDILSLTNDAAECITTGSISIADLLVSLEPFLTDVDNEQRSKGLQFLAEVLEKVPPDFLSPEETNVITDYFIRKLSEHFSITCHILKGLSFLVGMDTFPAAQVLNLLGNLQMNVTVQTLTVTSRFSYYDILHKLFLRYEQVLQTKPNDYVYAIVTGMDSEGDPRNLVFLFKFIPEVYSKFRLDHIAEEAFSVLECYFPIDFTPKQGGGITREDLASGLETCLCSSKEFGQFVFPMVLEKLESSLKVAQIDALKLLVRGFDVWELGDINPHASNLWRAFKMSLLQAGDSELTDMALSALVALLRRYSTSALSSSESETLDSVLKSITENTHRFLSDPTLTLFQPSTKILTGVAGASSFCCSYVVKTVVSQLVALAEGKKGHDAVLTALSPILKLSILYSLWNTEETGPILNAVPSTLIELLKDPSSQNGCLLCLMEIIPALTPSLRASLFETMHHSFSTPDPLPVESYSRFLIALSNAHPDEVREQLLEKITISDSEAAVPKKKKLRTLCWCCEVNSLTSYCADKIMHFIQSSQSACEAVECLRDYVIGGPPKDVLRALSSQCDLIKRLYSSSIPSSGSLPALKIESSFVGVSQIIEVLMRQLDAKEQQATCSYCVQLSSLSDSDDIAPIQMELLKGLLIAVLKEVQIPSFEEIVRVLVHSALRGNSVLSRRSSAILLASIVNKCQHDVELDKILDSINQEILSGLKSDLKEESISLLAWTAKGLIMRSHATSSDWLRKLITLLSQPKVSMEATNGFKIILSNCTELSAVNHCSERLLFKQWVFQWVFDSQLESLFNASDEESQKAAALAISYIVIAVPTSLVISAVPKLIKIFVLCLESQNVEVTEATLKVLSKLLVTQDKVFEEYIDELLLRFLNCCSSSSMMVRMNALDCLHYYGKYPESKLLPHRNKILRDLESVLDDRKRLVRQKASRTRSRWFLLGVTDDR